MKFDETAREPQVSKRGSCQAWEEPRIYPGIPSEESGFIRPGDHKYAAPYQAKTTDLRDESIAVTRLYLVEGATSMLCKNHGTSWISN